MTNDELIAQAEAALGGVTGGPWLAIKWGDGSSLEGCLNVASPSEEIIIAKDIPEVDAKFIAEARDLVPALIAALKASEARVRELEADLARAVDAMTDVSDRAMKTYRARNGRDCTIEASDGEACEIVHSDAMFGLRAVLNGLKGDPQ